MFNWLGKLIVRDHLPVMPYLGSNELLAREIVQRWNELSAPDPYGTPVFLWMPEWLNVWIVEIWRAWRKLRGLPTPW